MVRRSRPQDTRVCRYISLTGRISFCLSEQAMQERNMNVDWLVSFRLFASAFMTLNIPPLNYSMQRKAGAYDRICEYVIPGQKYVFFILIWITWNPQSGVKSIKPLLILDETKGASIWSKSEPETGWSPSRHRNRKTGSYAVLNWCQKLDQGND